MTPTNNQQHIDPDDYFAESRMTFGEHIEDLRTHLVRALKGFLIAFIAAFFIAKPVLRFIAAPVERQLGAYWDRFYATKYRELGDGMEAGKNQPSVTIRQSFDKNVLNRVSGWDKKFAQLREDIDRLRKEVGLPPAPIEEGIQEEVINPIPAFEQVLDDLGLGQMVDTSKLSGSRWVEMPVQLADPLKWSLEIHKFLKVIQPPTLTTLSAQEAFVYVKVALMTGFVLGSPWIFYQMWMFIAAGLYPHEKKYVNYFLPFSVGLFLAGVAVCEFFVMDKAIEALLWFNEFLGMAPDLRLNEWLGFAIFMPLIFGISFQTPLAMLLMQRVGVVKVETFRNRRRIIWFLMAVFAAVITPSTDPVSMLLLWVPMTLLFELGIWLCVFLPGEPLLDLGMPETEDSVEV